MTLIYQARTLKTHPWAKGIQVTQVTRFKSAIDRRVVSQVYGLTKVVQITILEHHIYCSVDAAFRVMRSILPSYH